MKRMIYILSLCLLAAAGLYAQPAPGSASGIRLVPRLMEVRDDSVRIHLEIRAAGISIPSDESLTLLPELQAGKKRVVLPAVVLSGAERARFDQRAATVRPDASRPAPYHVWSGVRRGDSYLLNYAVSLPYAPWMQHASLRLRQVAKDCCTERLLAYDLLTADINLPSAGAAWVSAAPSRRQPAAPNVAAPSVAATEKAAPQVVAPQAAIRQAAPVAKPSRKDIVWRRVHRPTIGKQGERLVSATARIAYPFRSSSVVSPSYGANRAELQKVDQVLAPLLENPRVRFCEIRVTCYLPSGSEAGGDAVGAALAESRALGLRNYLARAYGLQGYPLGTAWQITDGGTNEEIEVHITYIITNTDE